MFIKNKFIAGALISFSAFVCFSSTSFAGVEKFGPYLKRALENAEGPMPVIVTMRAVPPMPQLLWENQVTPQETELYLKHETLESQWPMRSFVRDISEDMTVTGMPLIQRIKFFWISNSMMATAAPEVVWHLAERPDVENVFLDNRVQLWQEPAEPAMAGEVTYTYGLERLRVPELRQQIPELRGQGIRVGVIDTGIDPDHPELAGRTVAFKDFISNKSEAYDDNGHGTHVAGTIGGNGVGGTQIGVAPEVKFIVAKVFSRWGSGSRSGIMRAMEWAANPDGNLETDDKPHVINNSWGGPLGGDANKDPYYQVVMNWINLNIFPAFAAGNSGPRRSTIGTPGGLPNAFAIGATDSNDNVASFSSRGPVKMRVDGERREYIKPDVSAPGHRILSAMPGGGYGKMSGTSMATPHAAGVVALMMQAYPQATVDQIKEALMTTSVDFGETGMDNDYGMGRVDALQATETLGYMVSDF